MTSRTTWILFSRAGACRLGLEGVISKRIDRAYAPGDRGLWVKSKCLNREEFVVVGWTDPEGSRSHIGALLLGYYTEDGRLHYAGRAGTGMAEKELKRLAGVLKPLQVKHMPLAEPPPRDSRFGSPLKLSKVHWVRPEVVVEVTYLTWTEDNLLRQVSYQGQREDKPARQVVRSVPPSSLTGMCQGHSLTRVVAPTVRRASPCWQEAIRFRLGYHKMDLR